MTSKRGDSSSEQGTRTTRLRQPTDKGAQWQLDIKKKDWKRAITAWRRASDKLRHILTDDHAEVDEIKSRRDALQSAMDMAIASQAALATVSPDEESEEARLETIEEEHSLLMKETYRKVKSLQVSSIKLSSSSSSSKRQQWLDQQPQPKASKEQSVDSGGEQAPEDLGSSKQRQVFEQRVPVQEPNQDRDNLLTDCLLEQLRLNRLPSPEPPVFDGDPLRYPAWKRAYDMLIEKKGIPPEDKFYYLLKYLKGQPLDLVQGYSLLSNDHAYALAKQQLDKRYGDTFVLSNAFRDKLDAWPKIGSKDPEGLRKYGDFLQQCNAASQFVQHLKHLDDERENRRLLLKLPDWLTSRWGRTVVQWTRDTCAFPPFTVFVDFVVREAEVACALMTPSKEKKSPSNARSLSTGMQKGDERKRKSVCQFCKAHHRLEDCTSFAARSMEEKRDFIRNGNLCFGCLKPGHRSKDCRNRSTCSTCKKRHPTILHDDNWNAKRPTKGVDTQQEAEEPRSSHASRNRDNPHASKTSTIVPVWLSHASSSKERLVYAMLDTQSDTTFVLRKTKEEMGITGTKVNLLLSTMTTAAEKVSSERITGFRVRALNSDKEIALPTTYTRDIMPANRSHIPTPEVAKNLPYLEELASLLSPILDCEIALLIGYDCPSALTPRAVIPSPVHGGPFAMQTDLGWSVVGTTVDECRDGDPIGASHRAMVRVLPDEIQMDGSPTEVVYSCQATVKEEIAPQQIIKLLESDFATERAQRPYSQNDVKFLSLMENEIRVTDDGHYETPLPFKETNPKLPYSKYMAEKRLSSLKRKFEKDSEYHMLYTQKIQTLIEKGYAEYVPDPSEKTDTAWYIPHHGVQQPNKLRVVFDCSAQCRGEALNQHLLTGPDLTNSLVGVLCRFRTDDVAFSCDIQEMFHQFHVRRDHRDYLRFLWWKDGDYHQPVCVLRMTVHLFGASSSPGCSNFCLKQLATDHGHEYGEDVKDFVHRDFYVDDGLKSVPTAEMATDLITRTRKLCERGGLHLHSTGDRSSA